MGSWGLAWLRGERGRGGGKKALESPGGQGQPHSPRAHRARHAQVTGLRTAIICATVLFIGFKFGRACLGCEQGSAAGGPDALVQEFARHGFLQVERSSAQDLNSAVAAPEWVARAAKGALAGKELTDIAVNEHQELQRQRLLLVENWRQIRAMQARLAQLSAASDAHHRHEEKPLWRLPSGTECRELRPLRAPTVPEKEKLRWAPHQGRFLLAVCVYGRASNRLRCLRNYILAATLLQRVLIVPEQDLLPNAHRWNSVAEEPYKLTAGYEVGHLNECLQIKGVVSLNKFLSHNKLEKLKVSKLLCWASQCGFHKHGKNMVPKDGKLALPRTEETGLAPNATRAEFLKAYANVPAKVLSLGDLFEAHAVFADAPAGFRQGLAEGWAVPPKAAVPGSAKSFDKCKALIWPTDAVVGAATGFVNEVLGARYAAVHLRRDDMFRQCVRGQKCPYWSQTQAGECVLKRMRDLSLEVLFLASDTSSADLAPFVSMLQEPGDYGPPIKVIRLGKLEGQMWAEGANRAGIAREPLTVSTVEKVICALGLAFWGTPGSSFSEHIHDMRLVFGTATCKDGAFCEGLVKPLTVR